ncbi:hypothetical protein TIFTF001_032792 [Ficus carica]|uniref:Uncharacterized protein n=1 Tax=Ficus carica TaxID=3494 RepID=A0AA88J751_FICCA|nr:hypothetical protein TIFTF001_032792 [Ficus carica]
MDKKDTQVIGLGPEPKVTYSNLMGYGLKVIGLRPKVINPKVTCSNQNPYPISFVITEGSLLLQPDLKQHSIGHSIQGSILTNDKLLGKNENPVSKQVKEKFSSMMASKLPRVVPTCHEGGFGPWFELDWTGRPNHSMAARHGKQHVSNV